MDKVEIHFRGLSILRQCSLLGIYRSQHYYQPSLEQEKREFLEEVQAFLDRTTSLVDGNGHRLVVRNGWSVERTVQTSIGVFCKYLFDV